MGRAHIPLVSGIEGHFHDSKSAGSSKACQQEQFISPACFGSNCFLFGRRGPASSAGSAGGPNAGQADPTDRQQQQASAQQLLHGAMLPRNG